MFWTSNSSGFGTQIDKLKRITGMKFLEDCPVQPLIPLYLLVGGVIGSLKVTLLLYDSTRMRQLLSKSIVIDDDDDDEYPWRQNAHKSSCLIPEESLGINKGLASLGNKRIRTRESAMSYLKV
ncbi:dehydrogenase reductase sdr family member 12 [Limosa lapponica baueri]|uniref:Dehydrogenase reductase sdr family member 12 n=1 Tax=Limosa lapponica baueri TaxID=1758121 RepID=A0A2I0U1J5_LIMLA|nr:dehydrogenase reductase sdr family member 12 [Limosa lapponica baueri]